jgi:hypothetical protein
MLFNNNPFFGIVYNPINSSLFIQNFTQPSFVPPPIGDLFWVEDSTGYQMVTEDGTKDYIFVGV